MEKTTRSSWEIYTERLADHIDRMEKTKPHRHEYATASEYNSALTTWNFIFHTDKPNPPGYEFANNH